MGIERKIERIQKRSLLAWETAVDTAGPEYAGGSSEKQAKMQALADECDALYDALIADLETGQISDARERIASIRSLESECGDCSHAVEALEVIEAYVAAEGILGANGAVNTTHAKRLAAGLCIDCGLAPHRPGQQRCDACAQAAARKAKGRRDYAASNGLCDACYQRNDRPDRTRCQACADKYNPRQLARDRARRAARRAARKATAR